MKDLMTSFAYKKLSMHSKYLFNRSPAEEKLQELILKYPASTVAQFHNINLGVFPPFLLT